MLKHQCFCSVSLLILFVNISLTHNVNVKDFYLAANLIVKSQNGWPQQQDVLQNLKDAISLASNQHEALIKNRMEELAQSTDQQCYSDLLFYFNNIVERKDWALQMFDATGKVESGILEANFAWLGNYRQCLSAQSLVNTTKAFRGKYCSIFLSSNNIVKVNFGFSQALRIGLCVPDSCSSENIQAALNLTLQLIGLEENLYLASQCQLLPSQIPWSAESIVMICVLGFLATIIFFCSVVDIFILRSGFVSRKEYSSGISVVEDVQQRVLFEASRSRAVSFEDQLQQESDDALPVDSILLTPPTKPPLGIFWRVCLSFSVPTNASKILNVNESDGTFQCLHGIRFLSMTWVILGHVYLFSMSFSSNLKQFAVELFHSFSFQVIFNASVSVDTFFFISGFLMAYLFLREIDKIGGIRNMNWFKFYFHRFWRLTPPYMLVLATYTTLYRYAGDGPLWPQNTGLGDSCHVDWWKNLLYINNFFNNTQVTCMGWSWYLANDMQFYILSPIILVPLVVRPCIGITMSIIFVLVSMIARGVVSKNFNYNIGFLANIGGDYFNIMYQRPWMRYAPFLIGILGGYLIRVHQRRIQLSKWLAVLLWMLSAAVALAVLYGPYDATRGAVVLSSDVSALYNSTFRVAWSLVLLWLVVACICGYGGWINSFLSWRAFVPLSRLTYLAYLVHPLVLIGYAQSRQQTIQFDNSTMAFLFLSQTLISYGLAFLCSLIFESPFMSIEKMLRA